jgi:hypothetical protein
MYYFSVGRCACDACLLGDVYVSWVLHVSSVMCSTQYTTLLLAPVCTHTSLYILHVPTQTQLKQNRNTRSHF